MNRTKAIAALAAATVMLLGACSDDKEQGLTIDSGTPQDGSGSDDQSDDNNDYGDNGRSGSAANVCVDGEGSISINGNTVQLDDDRLSINDGESSVNIDGSHIEIRDGDDGGTLVIDGNSITIDDMADCASGSNSGSGSDDAGAVPSAKVITADSDLTCNGEDVTVDGAGLNVDLMGSCGRVMVNGIGNNVNVDEAGTLTLSGDGHNVDVTGSAGTINLTGVGHNLDYVGNPTLNDDSVGSEIN